MVSLSPAPFPGGKHFFDKYTDGGRTESVYVDVSEIELRPSILAGRDVRAQLETSITSEANHLQDRCVDLATELFVLKNKVDEQAKELKWARREADAREKDFKEMKRLCEEERQSARSFMRQVKTLEATKRKLKDENADLRVDKERLLRVLRRQKESGLTESMAAHRDRLRKRRMSEKEVNKCDLASARLAVKATKQDNDRLQNKARAQANRIRALENASEELARQQAQAENAAKFFQEEANAARREVDEAKNLERRARSDMEHEGLLRLEALKRSAEAENAEREARAATASAELELESLRTQVKETLEKLNEKHSAHARHQGSVARYQTMIDTQASALQAAREQLLGEKVRRQEAERQARLKHIAKVDSKIRATAAAKSGRTRGVPAGEGGREPQRQNRQLMTPAKTRR